MPRRDDRGTEKRAKRVREPAAAAPRKVRSIAACAICSELPQLWLESDSGWGREPAVPPPALTLSTVVTAGGGTELRKCRCCGTHYYYSRDFQAADTCMQESVSITIRRYGPATVMSFLGGLVGGAPLPLTAGRFSRAFLDDTISPAVEPPDRSRAPAKRALAALARGYDATIADLERIVRQWHGIPAVITYHALESVCFHFCARSDWKAMSALLLHHADPAARLSAASLVTNIGMRNLSTLDFVHMPGTVRDYLQEEVANPARAGELAGVLRELAATTGEGASGDHRATTRQAALAALALLGRAKQA